MTTAVGKFEIKDWKEVAYQEFGDGRKLTRASVTQTFRGDIEGDGSVEWLMYYRSDGTAEIVGLQRFVGTLRADVPRESLVCGRRRQYQWHVRERQQDRRNRGPRLR